MDKLKELQERVVELETLNAGQKKREDKLLKQAGYLRLITRLAAIFLSVHDDKMYGEVFQVVLKAMKSKYGVFGYIDENGDLVCPSMTKDVWDRCRIPGKTNVFPRETWGGIRGRAITEKTTICSNTPFHVPEGHIPIHRAMDVPILYRGEVIGNLLVGNKRADYNRDDRKLLEMLADHIAMILYPRLQKERQEKEKKQAEEALKKVQEELIVKEKLAALGQFSASVAHELRNPLSVIDSSVYFLKKKLKGSDEKTAEHLDRIKSKVKSSTAVIESLLNLTQMKQPMLEKLDLKALASEVLSSVDRPAGIKVTKSFPEGDVLLYADRRLLSIAFKNILKNSIDAVVDKGSITVTIRVTPADRVEMSFSDTGPGIDIEDIDKIFQPFFSTKTGGTGFGLSIARMVIDRHKGTIEARSEKGKGVIFIIRLPYYFNKHREK